MKQRTTQPKNNKYYIRKVSGGLNGAVAGYPLISSANVLCNCVGYANGRFNEIINDPNLKGSVAAFRYQLVCNAENFIESAKNQGLKISKTPVLGGIMVWQKGATLKSSDGAGHVEVVEELYSDGSIRCSSSGYNGWAFRTMIRTNANGNWGQASAYKYRGCIINPAVTNKVTEPKPLTVDGIGGPATVSAMQRYFKLSVDGVISNQIKGYQKNFPALTSVTFGGKGGSSTVKALQKWLGVTADGTLGPTTIKAWQKKLGVSQDGIFGKNSMKAWQTYLNKVQFPSQTIETPKTETTATTPVETETKKSVYKAIDVSEWQGTIDWKKVKADGVDAAIIRYGDGTYLDPNFNTNMKNAIAAGIHVGCYIFSRAKNSKTAQDEATRLFNAAKKYKTDMPLYIDLEAKDCAKYADIVAAAFLNKMKSLGGKGGVYANLNWWNNYLTKTASNYSANPFWIAQYNDKMTHKKPSLFGMWQYSSSGKVSGISGNVDMNHLYKAYWENSSAGNSEGTSDWVTKANAWATKIAGEKYHYVRWSASDKKTQTCPICNGRKYDDHYGWNCIGFAFAVWHHGAGIPCKCNCGVIACGKDILTAKTDAAALSYTQKKVGTNDIQVIRNKNGIPKSQWKAGDICLLFKGETCEHIFYYMGNGKVCDSTSNPKIGDSNNIKVRGYKNYTTKVIIRYTGAKKATTPVSTEKKPYSGEFPSTTLKKTNAEVIADTIHWVRWIASDNRFHYGLKPNSQHNGCYFCKTQTLSGGRAKTGVLDYEFSYCCNPFVGAAWAHGGCVPAALKLCRKGSSWDFHKGKGYDKSSLFTNLGHPAKSKLKAGDVLCRDTHVALYLGDGKIGEASGGDDNKRNSEKWNDSIRVRTLTDANYKNFPRVHRFNSSVNTTACIEHGEVGKRVEVLQKFLKWYGYDISADGEFGDKTLNAVKKFQKAVGVTVDGSVGPHTIAKMKEARK